MDLLDFDDLLCLTVRLWEEHPDVLERYRSHYTQLMIDEYQDTNGVQLRLMTLLAGPDGKGSAHDERFWITVIHQGVVHHLLDKEIESYGLISVTESGMMTPSTSASLQVRKNVS